MPITPELAERIREHFAGSEDMDAIAFPVLLLGGGIGACPSRESLRLVTEYSLARGDVHGMRICDSAGREFRVRDAVPGLDLGPTGITRWLAVSYLLGEPDRIDFDEIRRYASDPEEVGSAATRLAEASDFGALYDLVIRLQP